jgi:hypothetical protein
MNMKLKLMAFILALTVASWAQTATQNTASPVSQEMAAPQAGAHCDRTAKDGQSCCHDKTMACCGGTGEKACTGGKNATSCMKGDKDKAASCGDCCGKDKDHMKNCCAAKK